MLIRRMLLSSIVSTSFPYHLDMAEDCKEGFRSFKLCSLLVHSQHTTMFFVINGPTQLYAVINATE